MSTYRKSASTGFLTCWNQAFELVSQLPIIYNPWNHGIDITFHNCFFKTLYIFYQVIYYVHYFIFAKIIHIIHP